MASRLFIKSTAACAALSLAAIVGVSGTAIAAEGNDSNSATSANSPANPPAAADAAEANKTCSVTVANITDFHGHIENAPIVETYLKEKLPKDTIFTSSGDSFGGSAYVSSVAQDEPTMEILNAMGLQVSALGNHEFDKGWKDIEERLMKEAHFTFLGTNVNGIPGLPKYKVMDVNGFKVGFVGATTNETPDITAGTATAGITFDNSVDATNKFADELINTKKADVVISLYHEAPNVAEKGFDKNVALVFAGHSHQENVAKTKAGAPILQAGSFGNYVAHAKLNYDCNTKEFKGISDEKVTSMYEVKDGKQTKDPAFAKNPAIEALVKKAEAAAEKLGKETIGHIKGSADRASRSDESPLGNLIADSFYQDAKDNYGGADLGIMNPGGLRANLDPDKNGVITKKELFSVQPFGNGLGMATYTGDQIYQLLEQQWQTDATGQLKMLRLGLSHNVTYLFDPNAKQGEHVRIAYINNKPVDRKANYRVASNSFLLGGKDGFTVLAEGKDFKDTGAIDKDSLGKILSKTNPNDPLVIDYTQRSIGWTGPLSIKAGDTVKGELSSLTFYNGEPVAKNVGLCIGGKQVKQFPIDPKKIEIQLESGKSTNDTTGTAVVEYQVPANAKDAPITLCVAPEITAWNVPLTAVVPIQQAIVEQPKPDTSKQQQPQVSFKEAPGQPQTLAETGSSAATYALISLLLLATGAAITGISVSARKNY